MLDKAAVAGRIKVLRGTLSQEAFAAKVGFKQTYISQIETGKSIPSIGFLVALADQFETTIDFVLRGGKMERIYSPEKIIVHTFIKSLEKIKQEVHKAGEDLRSVAVS